MTTDILPYLFSFVWPAACLLLVSGFLPCPIRMQERRGLRFVVLAVLAVGITMIPVGGLPLGRWFTGLCANFSLPLLAWIAAVIGRRTFNVELLGKNGSRAVMGFGVIAGIAIYPMALGLGPTDPYELGWSFGGLFVAVGALTMLLLWLGNRFSLVLLGAAVAFHLGLLESDNYWDYLVDPVYFLISLFVALRAWLRRCFRAPPEACADAA